MLHVRLGQIPEDELKVDLLRLVKLMIMIHLKQEVSEIRQLIFGLPSTLSTLTNVLRYLTTT